MTIEDQQRCVNLFSDISQCVKILDVNYKGGLTTKIEGVKSALEAIKDADYSCALIDYYQLIRYSIDKPGANAYEVLNDLRIYLGQYIKRSKVPVVVFAQLHSLGKRNNKDLDSRIKQGPEIYETATVVLEVIPNFDDHTSDFLIAKDRFGLQGNKIVCAFDHGRFVDFTPDMQQKIVDEKVKETLDKARAAVMEKKGVPLVDKEDLE